MPAPYSFLQIAGSLPFSSFIDNKQKKNKKTQKKKTIKKKTIQKKNLSRKKATRRKNLSHKKNPRDKRTNKKKINKKQKTNKKVTIPTLKKKTCNCDESIYYSGNEISPEGLGYCAICTPTVTMKGLDGNLWENKETNNKKKWIKVRNDMI